MDSGIASRGRRFESPAVTPARSRKLPVWNRWAEPAAPPPTKFVFDNGREPKQWVYNSSRKREKLPMSEEALRGWYWAGVIVSALALWVVWYMLVST
jgi:hypothetical protein